MIALRETRTGPIVDRKNAIPNKMRAKNPVASRKTINHADSCNNDEILVRTADKLRSRS
jgi:hypothetical protein